MLQAAMAEGTLSGSSVVLESSSGNMGIALAQACSYFGLRFICVVDPRTTEDNVRLLRLYGAEVIVVTTPDPATNEFLPSRIRTVKELLKEIPNSCWLNQYSNVCNRLAHYQSTMREIVEAIEGQIDVLVCPISTCGTITGCSQYVREKRMSTRIVAVDALGSAIFGSAKGVRRLPGLGAAVRPELFSAHLIDGHVHVSDEDCIRGCRRLLKLEAILAGASSGGTVAALDFLASDLHDGSVCVLLFPDRGDRYLSTVFCDAWVNREFPGLIP
jgi:cysteine synthase A